jgi:hypothetical protein
MHKPFGIDSQVSKKRPEVTGLTHAPLCCSLATAKWHINCKINNLEKGSMKSISRERKKRIKTDLREAERESELALRTDAG